jgi:hypothetical protein
LLASQPTPRSGNFHYAGVDIANFLRRVGKVGLIKIFEAMGDDPDDVNYVKPSDDDVWKFLALVKAWLMRPDRKGIPG